MQDNWSTMLTGVVEANEKAVAAAVEFNRIATRAGTRVARRQFAAFEDILDAGSKHIEAAGTGEGPAAVSRHAEIATELGEKLVAATQETIEIQTEARDELARWFEKGIEAAQTTAKTAAEPAKAPTRRTRRKTS